ncbi:hypothetical protein DFH06DRAFT_537560 [Mycena polygramma]|nr:hypothetical protein DFH06DRAFT_537560 [Mycena polygramma]
MVSRRLTPLNFCTFAVLCTALTSEAHAAPLRRMHRRSRFGSHPSPRQNQFDGLVSNLTGQAVSDGAALAQTLQGALFGGNSSSTADLPSGTADPFAQITGNATIPSISSPDDLPAPTAGNASVPSITLPGDLPTPTSSDSGDDSDPSNPMGIPGPDSGTIVSQFTSAATIPLPTGAGSGANDDIWSLLSEVAGAIETGVPSVPAMNVPNGGPWTSSSGPEDSGTPYGGAASQPSNCAETYTAVPGDTCAAISGIFNVSPVDFLRMNPTVGAACMNLEIGQQYCVQQGSAQHTGFQNNPWSPQPGSTPSGPPGLPGTAQNGGSPPFSPSGPTSGGLPITPPPPTLPVSDPGSEPVSTPNSNSTSSGPTSTTGLDPTTSNPALNATDPTLGPPTSNSTSDGSSNSTGFGATDSTSNSTTDGTDLSSASDSGLPLPDPTSSNVTSSDSFGGSSSGNDTVSALDAASQPTGTTSLVPDPLATSDSSDSSGTTAGSL